WRRVTASRAARPPPPWIGSPRAASCAAASSSPARRARSTSTSRCSKRCSGGRCTRAGCRVRWRRRSSSRRCSCGAITCTPIAGWLRPAPTPRAELDPRVKNVLLHLQLRGASFAQDLAKVAGLDTAATLSALWELFWAGLVTPDTFSAIAAGVAAPRAAAPGASRRRPRRGARRAPLARLPVIGRWSALAEEEGLSPEEREEARAHLLLARYGVLSRELAQGDWSTLRHTLLRMEYGGEAVRGYFVEGLS